MRSSTPTASRPARTSAPPGFGRSAAHLAALWGLAVLGPLFALLGDEAAFFVARGSTATDILVLALGYGLVPPLAAAGLVWAIGRADARAGRALLLVLVAVLAGALVLPFAGRALSGSAAAVAVALAAGAAFAVLYARGRFAGTVLTVLSPAPVVLITGFLLLSPVSDLVLPAGEADAAAGPARSQTPIVVVILDELPLSTLTDGEDRIDAGRFPHLARLAEDATWYRNATTVADFTTEAVPAQLTGSRIPPRSLPTSGEHPRNLFTLFARSHELLVSEPITDLCPASLCNEGGAGAGARLGELASDLAVIEGHLLLPASLRRDLPSIDDRWGGFGDDDPAESVRLRADAFDLVGPSQVRDGFSEVAGALSAGGERPPLAFVHSVFPHAPWSYLPDGRRYELRDDVYPGGSESWPRRQWIADRAFQRHLLQTRHADTRLGVLLRRLREAGLYDDAVVVVTADHGASFRAGERRRRPTAGNLADIANVPLLVKRPGQRSGRVDDRAVRTIDVLPTIAEAAGVELPWRVEGVPAGRRAADPDTPIDVLDGRSDAPIRRPLSYVVAQRRERDAHEDDLLAFGDWAVGPMPALVGSSGALPPAPVTLDVPGRYERFDPRAAVLPLRLTGTAHGLEADTVLAVEVNGAIAATTRVEPGGRFAAMVRPDAFRPGRNAVAVLRAGPG